MKFKNVVLSILCIFVFALTACSSNTNGKEEGSGKLKVVTTYSIIYDMVKQIGGEKVEIHSLVPIGANPHEYDPTKRCYENDRCRYGSLQWIEPRRRWSVV